MKLQVFRMSTSGVLYPVGCPKNLGQVTYLYGINLSYADTCGMRRGDIVRKHDAAGNPLYIQGLT